MSYGRKERRSESQALQLQEAVKAKAITQDGKSNSPAQITKIFKLHDDQSDTVEAAITMAKEMGSTEFDSVALEYVCIGFLAAPDEPGLDKPHENAVKGWMKQAGPQRSLEVFEQGFPDWEIEASPPD